MLYYDEVLTVLLSLVYLLYAMLLEFAQVARKKEREAASVHREARLALSRLSMNGPASINIEDKYRYMLTTTSLKKEGAADDAWND